MSNPDLPPDDDPQSAWDKLPKNAPSRQALPPMTGGTRWVWVFVIIFFIIVIFGILQGRIG